MKKTYINPKMEVVKIATHQMLATSVGQDEFGGESGSGTSGNDLNINGRDFDFDDEDEY